MHPCLKTLSSSSLIQFQHDIFSQLFRQANKPQAKHNPICIISLLSAAVVSHYEQSCLHSLKVCWIKRSMWWWCQIMRGDLLLNSIDDADTTDLPGRATDARAMIPSLLTLGTDSWVITFRNVWPRPNSRPHSLVLKVYFLHVSKSLRCVLKAVLTQNQRVKKKTWCDAMWRVLVLYF